MDKDSDRTKKEEEEKMREKRRSKQEKEVRTRLDHAGNIRDDTSKMTITNGLDVALNMVKAQ